MKRPQIRVGSDQIVFADEVKLVYVCSEDTRRLTEHSPVDSWGVQKNDYSMLRLEGVKNVSENGMILPLLPTANDQHGAFESDALPSQRCQW